MRELNGNVYVKAYEGELQMNKNWKALNLFGIFKAKIFKKICTTNFELSFDFTFY